MTSVGTEYTSGLMVSPRSHCVTLPGSVYGRIEYLSSALLLESSVRTRLRGVCVQGIPKPLAMS